MLAATEFPMPYQVLTRNQHFQSNGPKRILALDGGGIRGIVTLGYLQQVETLLKERHKSNDSFRLAHYFDLIAGTSTGAIIAAALALGMTVEEVTKLYLKLGEEVFKRSRWRQGILRARYSHEALARHLQRVLGKQTTLGSSSLKTGLLVITKRMDTGSPWPLGNNPKGKYFQAKTGDAWISNKDYPLWKVVRASTAAPSYFDPEKITISQVEGHKPVVGEFVDGGVSPFNNPTLQAVMYATLKGFRVGWEAGADKLLVVSVGTGRGDPSNKPAWTSASGAIQSLLSLMDDSAALVETMAQWLSTGETHREIDRDLGALHSDFLDGKPYFTYARYDLSLCQADVHALKQDVTKAKLDSLTKLDEPKNMALLSELARLDAAEKVKGKHFPDAFDLG